MSSSLRRAVAAAIAAALPTSNADLLAAVTAALGTAAVSPVFMVTFSIGQPSEVAITCANVVSWPWPPGVDPRRASTSPSA